MKMKAVLNLSSMDIYAMSDTDLVRNLQEAYELLDSEDSDADTTALEELIDSLETENQARGL